jgi:hypothetical protein
MKAFEDSDFVVTFTGENPASTLIRTWDRVLAFIDFQCGAKADEWTCRSPCCELHDHDEWTTLDFSFDGEKDYRHMFDKSEFTYCVGLHIVRLTDDLSEMFEHEIKERNHE